jgi:hypothetical protein
LRTRIIHEATARTASVSQIRFWGGSALTILLAMILAMIPASAMASSLAQPGLATYNAQAGGSTISVAGTVSENMCDSNGCGSGSVTVSGETASLSGSSSGNALAYPFSGSGTILYFYCVTSLSNPGACITGGPAVEALVDVSATVTVSAGTAGVAGTDALADAAVGVQGLSGNAIFVCATSAPTPQPCSPNIDVQSSSNITTSVVNDVASATAFLNMAPFDIFSDVVYEVELTASGQSNYGNGTSGDGTVMAMADPTIILDPTWAAENPGYGLLFSSNISSSPEPSSWTLLSAGLLATGFAIYRRKRRV